MISATPSNTDAFCEDLIIIVLVSCRFQSLLLALLYFHAMNTIESQPTCKQLRVAIITMGVKLADETRGYTRFRQLSDMLVDAGFAVDLYTSSFQHWDKAQRDTTHPAYKAHKFQVIFIPEPGYNKNLDLRRIASHAQAAKNLTKLLDEHGPYDLVYAEIPPNDVALAAARYAESKAIPFVVDVNDLWPEAMRMVLDIPVVSDLLFRPFSKDAKAVYGLCSAVVGTSDEYANRPNADREIPCQTATVYVGNDLNAFDQEVAARMPDVCKPEDEFWATYAGTLGASYDIATLIEAANLVAQTTQTSDNPTKTLRVKILGDGPDREALEKLAAQTHAPVDFLGYVSHDVMAAYLACSDITINSLKASAPQSIVTKIGDYLASGHPMINTGSSPEFRHKVEHDGFGVNVEAEHPDVLAAAILTFMEDETISQVMGEKARAIAETQFDQKESYKAIITLIRDLIAQSHAFKATCEKEFRS